MSEYSDKQLARIDKACAAFRETYAGYEAVLVAASSGDDELWPDVELMADGVEEKTEDLWRALIG